MAVLPTSVPSSSSDQIPPNSSSNTPSQLNPNSAQQQQQGDTNLEALGVPDEIKPDPVETFPDFDTGYTEKYKKYEADYVRRIKAKYFSKKNLYGGNIFDKETTIENETIKSSRWPCTRSYTDPVQSFEDHSRSSASAAEASPNLTSRKYQSKRCSS